MVKEKGFDVLKKKLPEFGSSMEPVAKFMRTPSLGIFNIKKGGFAGDIAGLP